jgi:hypothetical protein
MSFMKLSGIPGIVHGRSASWVTRAQPMCRASSSSFQTA